MGKVRITKKEVNYRFPHKMGSFIKYIRYFEKTGSNLLIAFKNIVTNTKPPENKYKIVKLADTHEGDNVLLGLL